MLSQTRSLKYALVYIIPVIVWLSISIGSWWSYSAITFVFVVVPFLELFTSGSSENLTAVEEEVIRKDKIYDVLLYSLVPVQFAILFYFLFEVSQPHPLYVKIGMASAFGMSCGILGINAAHEVGHRPSDFEQTMSKALLTTTLYLHFFIEHNKGHHKNVSTDDDPASARFGETLYGFYFRSITGSWVSAWHIEADRLRSKGIQVWSGQNEMLRFQIIQAAFIVLIGVAFSLETLAYFLFSAGTGILLLETVNYIEHYGLRRKKSGDHHERTLPVHSWNSNHPLGRLVLLELTRHSDHHYMASRKYQILRHFDQSPQMPTGYPGMMLLSLVPPLWFSVMHRRIEKYRQSSEGHALA